ncbi:hypothetical protein GCM10010508_16190 [Streptomyces naganishii JCM 4654]|uniref:Uncharacterized protein n=1 Tax=Streptomyces naganishii JCM 4654 TaxID=1306179 RepID=A0A919CU59_9ACTN|nr:hypothetical protein GCM10010508_16190 [Streptomyces naganishii JCM 4654]
MLEPRSGAGSIPASFRPFRNEYRDRKGGDPYAQDKQFAVHPPVAPVVGILACETEYKGP